MILDGHIHVGKGRRNSAEFVRQMASAGIEGGIVISLPPTAFTGSADATPWRERLADVLARCRARKTLYPFYWIDPLDDSAIDQVDDAVRQGIRGFKVICGRHRPGHERAMTVYAEIARRRRPMLFHSGILWDGRPSSPFNRPAEFEALLDVPGLRFSLAHISWPWCDELIAVYGKFQNAITGRARSPVEMFVDVTPGTPPIYRKEALTKLFTVGYDIQKNVVFGTDCSTGPYNARWAREWIQRDADILMGLGIRSDAQRAYFGGNLRRFVSLTPDSTRKQPLRSAE
jgi:hypothetical protein